MSKDIIPLSCKDEVGIHYARRCRKIKSQPPVEETKNKAVSRGKKSGSIDFFMAPKNKKESVPAIQKPKETRNYVSSLDTKWYFGDSLQVAVQVRAIPTSHRTALVMSSSGGRDRAVSKIEGNATFTSFKPIPKIISVWCYPLLENDPKSPMFSGFQRSEFIPLSSIFKEI